MNDFSDHYAVMDPGERDEGPFCGACGEHFPCEEVIVAKRRHDDIVDARQSLKNELDRH